MPQSTGDVLQVGSVPLDWAAEVFKTCAAGLGRHLEMFPDGEVGPRKVGSNVRPCLSSTVTPLDRGRQTARVTRRAFALIRRQLDVQVEAGIDNIDFDH